MGSFAKYIGGSPTNIACGTARLGLRSAVITRVGDEHMGRYVCEQLVREGVDVQGVATDPERLTTLVILGIRDEDRFPLIFYRQNCVDMVLSPDDIDKALIANARCVLATGSRTIPTVIVIDTTARPAPGDGLDGAGHFWDVAVPEVGETNALKQAYARYLKQTAKHAQIN